jgi:xanthine/uracil permease
VIDTGSLAPMIESPVGAVFGTIIAGVLGVGIAWIIRGRAFAPLATGFVVTVILAGITAAKSWPWGAR